MRRPFIQRNVKKRLWLWPLFSLAIYGFWAYCNFLVFWDVHILLASSSAQEIAAYSGDYGWLTPSYSVFYNAILHGLYSLVPNNPMSSSIVSLVPCAGISAVMGYSCYWLYRRGAPLWCALLFLLPAMIFVGAITTFLFLEVSAPVVALLILLNLKLIDAMMDDFRGFRKGKTIYVILAIFGLLILLMPIFAILLLPLIIVMSIMVPRNRSRAFFLSIATVVVFAIVELIVLQRITTISFTPASPPGSWIALMPVLTLAPAIWLLVAKSARYLLLLVLPLSMITLHLLGIPAASSTTVPIVLWFIMIFSAPLLFASPLMYEFSETKADMRARLLKSRAEIGDADRAKRSAVACAQLLTKIKTFAPGSGYIAVYSAFGSELTLEPLKAELGLLGYKLAYPKRISDHDIEFFTTIGVGDKYLLDTLLLEDPFSSSLGHKEPLLPQVEPSDIIFMVLPCVGLDPANNRLGYGKGCYDGYISKLPRKTPTCLVAFKEQLVDAIPTESHDKVAKQRVLV